MEGWLRMSHVERLDDVTLSKVRFGRNRFLAFLGTGLTGLAVRMFAPKSADAQVIILDICGSAACGTFGKNCSGAICTNCIGPAVNPNACTSVGSPCWFYCEPAPSNWMRMCCEWMYDVNNPLSNCFCGTRVGTGRECTDIA